MKICGVTRPDAIEAAAAAGAEAVGFVFAPSPRQLTRREAAGLARGAPPSLKRVGVFAAKLPATIGELVEELALDWVQADATAWEASSALVSRPRLLPVFRDRPGFEDALEAFLAASAPDRPLVLFEGPASGRGAPPDWEHAARAARRTPLVLAGGLNPGNVRAGILQVRPAMVDVSSGVESSPGLKDPRRIHAFVAEVRAAEQQLAEQGGDPR